MKLNQAKARRQLRRGSLVPRRGYYAQGGIVPRRGYRYPNGSIVWLDESQRLPEDMLSQLGWASIEAFTYSRASCATCGHRRKDHDGPATACRRYDTPDCPCVEFIEQEDE